MALMRRASSGCSPAREVALGPVPVGSATEKVAADGFDDGPVDSEV
jgi:hypothetical protein